MKTMLLVAVMVIMGLSAKAQTAIDKINGSLYQADKINSTLGTFKGLFGKKKDKKGSDTVAVAAASTAVSKPVITSVNPNGVKTTIITIVGVDFSKLKTINENVVVCGGVQSAAMKFEKDSSTINVIHSGTTDSLMKLIFMTCKDMFSEKNVVSYAEGAVKLKV